MTRGHRARPWSHPLALLPALWAVWLALAVVIAPLVIRAAWAGRAPALITSILGGRSIHGVEMYLGEWNRLALGATLRFGIVTALILAGYGFRSWLVPRLRPVVMTISVPVAIRLRDVLLLAAWTGTVLGLVEGGWIVFQRVFEPSPRLGYFPEVLWVTSLATALTLLLYGLVLSAAAVTVWRRQAALRVVPAALAVVGTYAVIRQFGGVHPAGAMVLAIGVTVGIVRLLSADPARSATFLRRSGIAMASMLIAYGLVVALAGRLREARALATLPDAPRGAYNVLFLILDTVRAQDLSVYGYARPTTPAIEQFARKGAVFESAWSTAPWTLPSHASMFTGVPSHRLSADYTVPLDGEHPTLAEVLGRSGYATGGFVANYYFAGRPSGLARGFMHYEDRPVRPDFIAASAWLPRRVITYWKRFREDHSRLVTKRAEHVNQAFLDWLPATQGHPFFAFINYLDAHDPYAPPEPWDTLWAKPGSRYGYGFHEEYTKETLQEFRDHYDGGIAYIDAQIGELLREMDRRGLLDNTLVVITSDHGEEFGEHAPSLVRHGWSLYSPSLRVPLIMVLPGVVPEGTRLDAPVSTANIAATILDIVTPHPSYGLPGRSLTRFWSDSGEQAEEGDVVVSAVTRNPSEAAPSSSPIARGSMSSIIDDRYHFILNGDDVVELYDIVSDPWELHDLAGAVAYARIGNQLRKRLHRSIGVDPQPPLRPE